MILICDDDPVFSKNLKALLGKEYASEIHLFSSCEELIVFLTEEKYPSILFMDLMMPVNDGYQCMKMITKSYPAFPVIGMTSGTAMSPGIDNVYAGELFELCFSAIFVKSRRADDINKYIDAAKTMWIDNPIQPEFKKNNHEHTGSSINTSKCDT